MTKSPFLSVVIPAYNEATNFRAKVLEPAFTFLAKQTFSWEVIFVDDGSTDDTYKLLQAFCSHHSHTQVVTRPHQGKATAVTYGMLKTSGKYALFTDFDQSTPLDQFTNFISAHESGADIVIGVRGEGQSTKSDTLIRKIRSKAFLILVQLIALPGIRDSQCGFKSFTHSAAQKVFSSLKVSLPHHQISGGYMGAFDVEVLFLSRKFGYSISQIPVDWVKIPSNKLNVWKEPIKMVVDTLKVRFYDLLGKYHEPG